MQILLDKVKRPGNRKLGSNGKSGNGKPHRMRNYYTTLNHSEQLLGTYRNLVNLDKQETFDFHKKSHRKKERRKK